MSDDKWWQKLILYTLVVLAYVTAGLLMMVAFAYVWNMT